MNALENELINLKDIILVCLIPSISVTLTKIIITMMTMMIIYKEKIEKECTEKGNREK